MLQTCTVMFFLGGRQQGSGNDIFFFWGGVICICIDNIYIYTGCMGYFTQLQSNFTNFPLDMLVYIDKFHYMVSYYEYTP